ncbi:MAG: NAD-dependent glycerol-3-phosphate dehydrogenase domain protein [Deltaproteobacteria bacterium]|nr:NAD-dependent glycerol-3-phosphate dehydrogenase domain protein [Deltaproteobacteria bacterium]
MPASRRRIAVIGAGSWGTTLANLLAEKEEEVLLWVYEEDLFRILSAKRENDFFLPGVRLADSLRFTHSLEEALAGRETVVCAVPSHAVREVFLRARPYLSRKALLISVTKGLEDGTYLTMSRVLQDVIGSGSEAGIGALSGPSFAREVCRRIPTAVAAAGTTDRAAQEAQALFFRPYFRVYTNPDLAGVELGGAVKNVMAIAAGASDGMGFGHSSRAALITRGLAEMTRLGMSMGALRQTFFGLAGLGDLVLTCTGDLSRNRQVGLELGKGKGMQEILGGMRMVAEGVRTAKALWELARIQKVEMPIAEKVYEILYHKKNPQEAVQELMSRLPRSETEALPLDSFSF